MKCQWTQEKIILNTKTIKMIGVLHLGSFWIWLKAELSLAPLYWYVTEWKIWGNPITGHIWVPSNENGDCATNQVLLIGFACYMYVWAIRLVEKGSQSYLSYHYIFVILSDSHNDSYFDIKHDINM